MSAFDRHAAAGLQPRNTVVEPREAALEILLHRSKLMSRSANGTNSLLSGLSSGTELQTRGL